MPSSNQCVSCKHYLAGKSCDAYDEIPDAIFFGEHDHRQAYPGDSGVRFEVDEAWEDEDDDVT